MVIAVAASALVSGLSAGAQEIAGAMDAAPKPDPAEVRRYVDGVKLTYQSDVLTPVRSGGAGHPPIDVDLIADHLGFEKAIKAVANSEQRKMLLRFREKYQDCWKAAAPSFDELDQTYVERVERCGEGISDRAADVIAAGY